MAIRRILSAIAMDSFHEDESASASNLHFDSFQLDILRWTPVLPALLSVAGSLLIIQRIVRSKELLSKTYERLMLGLSLVDTLNSIRLVIFPLVYRPYTAPSTACTIEGFVVTLGFAGPVYNAVLTFYYVLIIIYNVPNQRIITHYEPWLHVTAVGYGLVGAFLGLSLGVFNPNSSGLSCWAAEWPTGCLDSENGVECERGESMAAFSYAVGLLPLFGVLFALISGNTVIYCTVRRIVAKTETYTSPAVGFARATVDSGAIHSSVDELELASQSSTTTSIETPSGATASANNNTRCIETPSDATASANNNTRSPPTVTKTTAVAVQSISYVLAYLICFIWPFVIVVVEVAAPSTPRRYLFVLHMLEMIFYPIQGLFNALVYVRPMVTRLRRQDPGRPRWQCVLSVLFD